jgi:predicted Zn-dependent protease
MKTRNTFLAALILGMLGASSCATLNTAAVEQEELNSQIQKEQTADQYPGRWVDANGWDNEAMGDGD